MWTYRNPYLPFEYSEQYIRKRGLAALSYALSVRRLVCFAGSGLTAGYGLPTWDMLLEHALKWTVHQCDPFSKDDSNFEAITQKVDAATLTDLVGGLKTAGASPSLREAKGLLGSVAAKYLEQTKNGGSAGDHEAVLQICEHVLAKIPPATGNGKENRVSAFRAFLAGKMQASSEDTHEIGNPSAISILLNDLNVTRFATLNYDVLIEKDLAKWLGEADADGDFVQLAKNSAASNAVTVADDPSARRVRSAYLTDANMAELVNFSLLPRGYDAEVFHLHGRADGPGGMVLNQRDYQRTWLKSGTSEDLFEAAVGSIFAANDVLFAGVGLNEPDVMRPLRKAMARSRERDLSRQHIFALLPFKGTNVRKALCDMAETAAANSPLKGRNRAATRHFSRMIGLRLKSAELAAAHKKDLADDAVRTISNFEKYGIFTISYGREDIGLLIGMIDARSKLQSLKPKGRNSTGILGRIVDCWEQETKKLDPAYPRLAVALYDMDWRTDPVKTREKYLTAIRTWALETELRRIAERRDEWWQDWRERPAPRDEKFAAYTLPNRQDNQNFSRHRTYYFPLWHDCSDQVLSDKFKGLTVQVPGTVDAIKDELDRIRTRRDFWGRVAGYRLCRVVIRRGGGKGALIHLLQAGDPGDTDKLVLDRFHPRNTRYTSSFVVNLSYSVEFASVIDALIDFFRQLMGSKDEPASNPHRVMALREVMRQFGEKHTRGQRLFICFSGIDRLCDARGLIANGMFRRFFATLTGKGLRPEDAAWAETLAALPIDVLLVSGRENRPPRYMSDEARAADFGAAIPMAARPDHVAIPGTDVFLRRWPVVPSLQAGEYFWLQSGEFDAISSKPLKEWLDGKAAAATWFVNARQLFGGDVEKKRFDQQAAASAQRDDNYGLIRLVIEAHRQHLEVNKSWPLAISCLRHLALFPMPVARSVLEMCPRIAAETGEKSEPLDGVLNHLVSNGLAIKIRGRAAPATVSKNKEWDEAHCRYTLHHLMREYVARKTDLISPDDGDQFDYQVTLFCHQPVDIPSPAPAHYKWVRGIVERLLEECRSTVWCLHQLKKGAEISEYQRSFDYEYAKGQIMSALNPYGSADVTFKAYMAVPQRLRAIYGMLRGGFTVGAVLRLDDTEALGFEEEPLDRVKGWLRGIGNAAVSWKKVREAEGLWPDDAVRGDVLKAIQDPFYRDEIGWLINERGVIALTQGLVYDAIPLFREARRAMEHKPSAAEGADPAWHASERRISLNLAVALLDRGSLDKAERELRKLVLPDVPGQNLGSQVSWIADGYLGLINHLYGDLQYAARAYDKVLARASQDGMLRVVSIFAKHGSDLFRRQGEMTKAARMAVMAIDAAQNSEQRDLVWMARLTQVRLWLAGDVSSGIAPLRVTDDAIRYAELMNLSRLRSEGMRLKAECLMASGDAPSAAKFALDAAAIANRAGLRLMKVTAMAVYAKALDSQGLGTEARSILQTTLRETRRRRFDLHVGDIQQQIESLR